MINVIHPQITQEMEAQDSSDNAQRKGNRS